MSGFWPGPRLRAMSRWLLVLIALLLPLQLAWASLGEHCGDSHEASAVHGLHHAHDQALDEHDDPATPDCGHCHGHVSALPLPLPSLALTTARQTAQCLAPPRLSAISPPPPDRPQWQRLA